MNRIVGAVLLAATFSCGRSTVRPIAPLGSEAAAIATARGLQNAALRVGDIDSAATFWTADVVVTEGLGGRVRGIEDLKKAFASDGHIRYERLPSEVHVSSGWPLAWESGSWVGRDRAAHDSTVISGRYSAQWVRTGPGWKIHSELFVADRCVAQACAWPLAVR